MPTMSAEYIAAYRKRKYADNKTKIINLLGSVCKKCGSTLNLEVHHIDPKEKNFEVMEKCWCMSWKKLIVEINKCQLLCEKCHTERHTKAKGTHGTLSAWRYCKCDICRACYNKYMREYKKNKRAVVG